MIHRRRAGIATVVGMLFMALIFLMAMGAEVYVSDAQGATAAAQARAEQRLVQKGQEMLTYGGSASTLEVTNSGALTTTEVGMLLKLENGTVYNLNGTSSPPFAAVVLPAGSQALVRPMVPSGACNSGGTTCVALYLSIVDGRVPGREVGLITSSGNTFWYVPSAATSGNQDPTVLRTTAVESTSALAYTRIPGLAFSGGPSTFYEIRVTLGYWQEGPSPNSGMFAVGATNGTSFMFCGGMDWSDPAGSFTDLSAGNACTAAPGVSLGPTWSPANGCNLQAQACEFVGTAYVSFGPSGGTFAMEFQGIPSGNASVFAESVMTVTQVR